MASNQLSEAVANGQTHVVLSHAGLPWQEVINKFPSVDYLVFPSGTGAWYAQASPTPENIMIPKFPFPSSWHENPKEGGAEDAIFAHKGCFIVGAKSLEGVLKMVETAESMRRPSI